MASDGSQRALQGLKYFRLLGPLLERLAVEGAERDRAGRREWFFDHHASLVLLYFFNATVTSLRGLQRMSELDRLQKKLGVPRVSLGALSEAARVFDSAALVPIVDELAQRCVPLMAGREAEALAGLTAVDGTVLKALPRMTWALWQADHRGAKLHVHFDVARGVPVAATLTPAAQSEITQLRQTLAPDRLYVLDRGYASFQLMRDILDAGSSFVLRVKDNTALVAHQEERPLTELDHVAGVVRDVVVKKLGTAHHKDFLQRPVRLVVVQTNDRTGESSQLWLVTDRLDLPADLVALAYRRRWTVELFFRWLKSILGVRHLLSTSQNGLRIQMYVALIASLLIVLWTGRKLNKPTWEMIQHYLNGWATLPELQAYIQKLKPFPHAAPP